MKKEAQGMPRFFVTNTQISDGTVTVTGADAHHISRALRMAVGDTITVCDMSATEYECELTHFLPDCVKARVISSSKNSTPATKGNSIPPSIAKMEYSDRLICAKALSEQKVYSKELSAASSFCSGLFLWSLLPTRQEHIPQSVSGSLPRIPKRCDLSFA